MTPSPGAAVPQLRPARDVAVIEVPVLSEAILRLGVPLSLVTAAGPFVFVSGIPPLDLTTGAIVAGDIAIQTAAALDALTACLAAAGLTREAVVSVRVYAANAGHYGEINRVYRGYFDVDPPARTFVPVGSWPGGFDLEIDCVAWRGDRA